MEYPLTGKALMARQFARSRPTYDRSAIVQRYMARQLVRGIADAIGGHPCKNVLEIGCGTGLLTEQLVQRLDIGRLMLNDIVPDLPLMARRCRCSRPGLHLELCPGDMESVPLPAEQDLVAANAVLQWAREPHAMLEKMTDALKPGGILAIATFGPSNLRETRDLTGASLHYLSRDELQLRLAVRTDVLECYEWLRTISFRSAYEVLQHLKRTGVNSLQRSYWSPRAVKEFCEGYESRFRAGNRVPLTYHPIIVVARRRGS